MDELVEQAQDALNAIKSYAESGQLSDLDSAESAVVHLLIKLSEEVNNVRSEIQSRG